MAPRVLLTSVFKPFGVDNIYGRKESRIELYHNQITKYQDVFSLRAFFNSFGLHVIANNIEVPTTVLDFPTLPQFVRELKQGYDFVGISGIQCNFQKIKKMVETAREVAPQSTLVLGGFCTTLPGLRDMLDVDHVCVGEGVGFMRALLGLPPEFHYKNPDMYSAAREVMGAPIRGVKYPYIAVGLGCPYGCDFCSPSHFFGRRHIKYYKSGRDLFTELMRVKKRFRTPVSTLIGDDNFLLDRERAEELRQCVIESGEMFNISLFGSADKVAEFGPERLAEMGVNIIWIGREGKFSAYAKNQNANLKSLVAELKTVGIKTILSSILLLEQHTKENIIEDIDDHIACEPAFSQFAHYSPAPGTPLYERLEAEGRVLDGIPLEEWHAFKQPWFSHPQFTLVEAERVQEKAYTRDFLELGPSLLRYIATDCMAWRRLKDSDKPHLRKRADAIAGQMWKNKCVVKAIALLAPTTHIRELAQETLAAIQKEFGGINPAQYAVAQGLHLSGRIRRLRTALWGDNMQPPTQRIKYNY